MQITNIKNNISYKSSLASPQITSSARNVDNYKKDFLQKHYEEQYKKDLKNYNLGSVCGFAFCLFAIIAEAVKENKKGAIAGGIVLAICTPLYFMFKPKKEKYDETMQIELSKEVINENSSNK